MGFVTVSMHVIVNSCMQLQALCCLNQRVAVLHVEFSLGISGNVLF